jgi:hypothetical protein
VGWVLTLKRGYYASLRVFDRQTLAFLKKKCAYAHFSALCFFEQNLNVSSGIINDVDGGNLVFFSIILVSSWFSWSLV